MEKSIGSELEPNQLCPTCCKTWFYDEMGTVLDGGNIQCPHCLSLYHQDLKGDFHINMNGPSLCVKCNPRNENEEKSSWIPCNLL